MRAFLSFLMISLVSQASAQGEAIGGRMICEVTGSRFVAAVDGHSKTEVRYGEGFPLGATLTFEYSLDEASGLSIYLGDTDSPNVLIDEPF